MRNRDDVQEGLDELFETAARKARGFERIRNSLREFWRYGETRAELLAALGQDAEIWHTPDGYVGLRREEVERHLREQAALNRARRTAAGIGLQYWPALLVGGLDPKAMKIAEEVLASRVGSYWGDTGADNRRSRGGWDSAGYYGLSGYQVRQAWFAAGCKDGGKFRLSIRRLSEGMGAGRKGDTLPFLFALTRGLRWARRNAQRLNLSRKALAALGRISAPLRWAAISGLVESTPRIRIRDLNWAAVKEAQKGAHAARAFLPESVRTKVEWAQVFPALAATPGRALEALTGIRPRDIKVRTLRALMADQAPTPANLVPAVQLVRLFGADLQAIRRFVGERSVHDAGQFTLPPGCIDPAWGRLVLTAPELIGMAGIFGAVEAHLGRPANSQREFRAVLVELGLDLESQGDWYGVSGSQKEDYRKLYQAGSKTFVGVPAPGGLEGVVLGKYSLCQLAYNDPVQALAGRLVNCCQHLHGAAASCARQAWQEGDAAIWAVYRDGRMVGQSFVWRSAEGGELVLDSVECLSGHEPPVAEIMLKAAQAVVGRMSVRRVLVGASGYGATAETRKLGVSREIKTAPVCAFGLSYSDAHRVSVLVESPKVAGKAVRKAMAAAVAEARTQVQGAVFNIILEGSGVVCEHCDTEVHPDCEICPVCGQNIAEWVEV